MAVAVLVADIIRPNGRYTEISHYSILPFLISLCDRTEGCGLFNLPYVEADLVFMDMELEFEFEFEFEFELELELELELVMDMDMVMDMEFGRLNAHVQQAPRTHSRIIPYSCWCASPTHGLITGYQCTHLFPGGSHECCTC